MGLSIPAVQHQRKGGSAGSIGLHNTEAALFAQAVFEMQRLIRLLGGRAEIASWLPGVGDLDVTCNGGRTGRFGRLLGLGLIAVPFPKSADGRGFSIAPRLRRMGYAGELRASGHLIADQYALARSCGFDTVEISDGLAVRQPEAHWIEAERAMTLAYQRGYGNLRSILSARWAAG